MKLYRALLNANSARQSFEDDEGDAWRVPLHVAITMKNETEFFASQIYNPLQALSSIDMDIIIL